MAFQFNQITLDPDQYRLIRAGEQIHVEPQAFDLLVYLLKHRNRVVTRDELLENLWKGKVVSDSALGATLKDARKAVGDSGSKQEIIRTIHGRGYRFVADVDESEISVSEKHSRSLPIDNFELPDDPSVAVMPFSNMSGDPDQEHFADGMTDEIITRLCRVPGLFVIANHSTRVYKGLAINIKDVAREQGVRYVLEGGIRKSGSNIRVTAQLIDGGSGRHLWADIYDRELEEIFSVQDDIAHQVAIELQVRLITGERSRLSALGTQNVVAWELASNAKFRLEKHVRDESAVAKQLVLEALEIDPNYSAAWAMLGWILWEEAAWDWVVDPSASIEASKKAAIKSLENHSNYPAAYSLLGYIHHYQGEIEQALEISKRAADIAPTDSSVIALLGNLLIQTGHISEGIQRLQRAIRLCPIPPSWYLTSLGLGHHLNCKNHEAIPLLKRASSQEPESIYSWLYLASALVESDSFVEAREISNRVKCIDPEVSSGRFVSKWLGALDYPVQEKIRTNLIRSGIPD